MAQACHAASGHPATRLQGGPGSVAVAGGAGGAGGVLWDSTWAGSGPESGASNFAAVPKAAAFGGGGGGEPLLDDSDNSSSLVYRRLDSIQVGGEGGLRGGGQQA